MTDKKRKRDEVAENISDELREVYRKKIKQLTIVRGSSLMDRSRNYKTLEEYGKEFWSVPPEFMIVGFEDGSEVGVLKGKQIVSAQVYRSLQSKIKEAVKKAVYSSPNGIKNEKIDEILPKILFSAVDSTSGEAYLSDAERTLAKELGEPDKTTIFKYIAKLWRHGDIREEVLPGIGTLYFPPEK